jgi:hypothetical protein
MARFKSPINVKQTIQGSLEPIDIYGNWIVTEAPTTPPNPGIAPQISKFSIRRVGDSHVLKKTGDGVAWNGSDRTIKLHTTSDQKLVQNNTVLVATIELEDGTSCKLALGSVDSGNTLLIDLFPAVEGVIAGGSGSAGRGS